VQSKALLLDTCALVNWVEGTLPTSAHQHLASARHRYISVVSAWEIRLKRALRVITPEDVDRTVQNMGLTVQPLLLEHMTALAHLHARGPLPHDDPFDHMLIAQALLYGWPILTCDTRFGQYLGVQVVW
jgi:PIN domain nuclease of toxin-antitoxin system